MFDWNFLRTKGYLILAGLVGVFMVCSLLGFLFSSQTPSVKPFQWELATEAIDRYFLTQIIQQNSTTPSEVFLEKVQVITLSTKQQPLYIIDFNSPSVCGVAGCLYVVYRGSKERALALLLNPNLPKSVNLFSLAKLERNGYPCLLVNQPKADNAIFSAQFCYENWQFVPTNQQVVEGAK